MANDKKGGATPLAKAEGTPTALALGSTGTGVDREAAALLAQQLGFKLAPMDDADDFESVRGSQGLYRPEDCILGTDGKGRKLFCPIRGYPVGAVSRTDPTNGPYIQALIQLTHPCIALKGKGENRERVLMQKGECVVVTATYALEEVVRIAADMSKSVEVQLDCLGKIDIGGGHTMWDWSVKKSRKSIPRVVIAEEDEFPPADRSMGNGATPQPTQ